MTATVALRRITILLLWVIALSGAWACRGLYADGAAYLAYTVEKGGFMRPDAKAREYAIAATQIPLVIALKLGVADLHWLARAYSLGLFGVPAALYQLALMRAKDDAVLLAAVIAAIALAFLTTSTFIVGEFHTGYALTIAAAVWIVTCRRWTLLDGFVLTLFGLMALRTYESFVFFGPLLAAMIVFGAPKIYLPFILPGTTAERLFLMMAPLCVTTLALSSVKCMLVVAGVGLPVVLLYAWRRPGRREGVASLLGLLALLLFLAGAPVALMSIVGIGHYYLLHVADTTFVTWRHIPLDLMVVASLCLVIWAIARPEALRSNRPYLLVAPLLAILALSPLGAVVLPDYPPLTGEHYLARSVAVVIVLAIVGVIAVRRTDAARALPVFAALETEAVARRCLFFFFAMLVAALPSVAASTITWTAFLDSVRGAVRSQHGGIAYESLPPLVGRVYWFDEDAYFCPELGLVVRGSPDDAAIAPPVARRAKQMPDIGSRVWKD